MQINVGDYVYIEGSDRYEPWEVTAVNKYSVDLRDSNMGIIELENVEFSEILEVITADDLEPRFTQDEEG